jgi:branched-chain amino acid transport system substrate-binding protein
MNSPLNSPPVQALCSLNRLFGRRPRKLLTLAALLLALPVATVACGGDDDDDDTALASESFRTSADEPIVIPAEAPIVIGLSFPVTGSNEQSGLEDRDAVATALSRWKIENSELIADHEVALVLEDDGCTEADIAAQAAERLMRREGLVAVLGPYCSAGAEAAIPVLAGGGIVTISGSATQSDLTTALPTDGFFFRTAYTNQFQGDLIALFLISEQVSSVYVIDDGESYGLDLADAIQTGLEGGGVDVMRESVEQGAVDFSELAGDVATSRPDFVVFAGFNPEVGLLYRQLRDAGYDGPFGSGDAAASVATFVEPVGVEAAEGVFFSGCALTPGEGFLSDFVDVHGEEPGASTSIAQYADATTILLDAVAAVAEQQDDGSLVVDPAALRNAVRDTELTGGVSGNVAFDDNGDRTSEATDLAERALDLGWAGCQVQDGQFVVLFP